MGHSMSDPVHGVYRTKEDVEQAKQRDPIHTFIVQLRDNSALSETELKAIDQRVQEEVEDAAKFADESPESSIEELYTDVYAEENEHGRLFFDRKNRLEA
jgi:pyruvate dehydrogenase E1 component alpha subunit